MARWVADIVVFLFSCRGRIVSVETLCRCASGAAVKGACVSAWHVDLAQTGGCRAIYVPGCSTGLVAQALQTGRIVQPQLDGDLT
jgi:hypothetical protein